jgi:Copper amine oxidase, enzyme domain/Domain of unknown function (DUF1965)
VHSIGMRFDVWSLLPQGLYCGFGITGRDTSKWTIHELYCNGVLYSNTSEFRAAWERGELNRVPLNRYGRWILAEPDEKGRPDREMTPQVLGFNMYELVQGYDCPAYATYLLASFPQGDSTITRNNSFCIFEYTADHAIQRHTSPSHVTTPRNNYLVVRSVSSVGNYDNAIDFILYLDGTFEVKVRASGYIFGAYHTLDATRKELHSRGESKTFEYGY